ncbi:hypothetical protein GWL_03830 [Herbaspirillum sp. GW103]|uniref:anti-sigma factor n=1 Tax=unclassified Herbaspirillum TaxID=2624150 RepID=UPI00025E476B|nr:MULTISPECIES: anti-sigma factor [unclassified Herbaspirillum]EIJ48349.1 hypothetical protein GWL_03830 [Herbaspirillum sp. GW103]MCI1006142.1 anti-sigma factor [Herbaspirillum sp. C7C8]NUT60176.1 RNA polymerase subunit sigma-70 [Herbaspirillum sp. C9C3]
MNASHEDLQWLAAQYVLGTLPYAQRQEVERRLPTDPALRAAVDDWEAKLHPLTALAEPVQPSTSLWQRIERSLPAPAAVRQRGGWRAWWESVQFWRWSTATALACSVLLAVIMLRAGPPTGAPAYMVVLVAPQDKAPGWVVQTGGSGRLNLIPLGVATVPQEKALQFWTKGSNWNGPVSLGLVKPGKTQEVALDKLPPLQPDQLFEITLEPGTGSPTGRPTGPILYIGRAVKVTS